MSSVTVSGILEIAMGKQYLPPDAAPGTKSLHTHYISTIQTTEGVFNVFLLKTSCSCTTRPIR